VNAVPTFTRAQLQAFRGVAVPDLAGDGMKLLFVGVNPGLRSAALGAPFAGTNRFYPALAAAGVLDRVIDTRAGFEPADRTELIARGIGVTCFVNRATATAREIPREDMARGIAELVAKATRWRPRVVAILGTAAFRDAFGRTAVLGPQPERLGPARLWVVPNPSGRNLHASMEALADAYREVAIAAGVVSARSARSSRS
jgi:double-stranded uracil-DNA glycosylase